MVFIGGQGGYKRKHLMVLSAIIIIISQVHPNFPQLKIVYRSL